MPLYRLNEGKLVIRLAKDEIDNIYRLTIGKHMFDKPGKTQTEVTDRIIPLRDPVILETYDKQQALNLMEAFIPGYTEKYGNKLN